MKVFKRIVLIIGIFLNLILFQNCGSSLESIKPGQMSSTSASESSTDRAYDSFDEEANDVAVDSNQESNNNVSPPISDNMDGTETPPLNEEEEELKEEGTPENTSNVDNETDNNTPVDPESDESEVSDNESSEGTNPAPEIQVADLKIIDGCTDNPDAPIVPDQNVYNGLFFDGSGESEVFMGEGLDDFMMGGKGGDTLIGGAGNDFLFGEGQKDTLIGGEGVNILRGGSHHDKFKFVTDQGLNIIEDFTGKFGEHIDLSDLLLDFKSSSDINEFVRFSIEDKTILMEVDKDGPKNISNFKLVAILLTGKIIRDTNYALCSQKRMIAPVKLDPKIMIQDGSLIVSK